MSTNVHLTPELERFARECVSEGRYNNVSEVVRSGLRLLQEQEELRRELTRSLREAEEESDREGWFAIEEVAAEMDAVIDAAERKARVDADRK
jgi:antitoxin ParD1/3/4